jgi:hypothetical protein
MYEFGGHVTYNWACTWGGPSHDNPSNLIGSYKLHPLLMVSNGEFIRTSWVARAITRLAPKQNHIFFSIILLKIY